MDAHTHRPGRGSSHSSSPRSFSSHPSRSGGYDKGRNAGHATGRTSHREGGFHSRGGSTPFRSSGHSRSGARPKGRKQPTFDPSQFINTNPVKVDEVAYKPKHTFKTFGLDQRLERSVAALGISIPSPIQDQIIPHILKGEDVIGIAETGTGKTAAFLLPLIEKTLHEYSRQTLIMTPTRELALQIEGELRKLAPGMKIFSTVCVGGTSIRPQIAGLRRQNHFVIGTPGRLLDLINRRDFNASKVTTVVLDEADRMLDMGFITDMRLILKATRADRETLFFSATMTREAEALVNDFMKNPTTISVKKKDVTNSVAQDVVYFDHHAKFEKLTTLLEDSSFSRVLIFGAMKHSVEKLSNELGHHGIKSDSIHGNKNHSQRQRALQNFKSGHVRVLVATDVAARGIHVDNVSHVINYDLPNTFEDYVHRIGRTGRGDKHGMALTFVPKAPSYHTTR